MEREKGIKVYKRDKDKEEKRKRMDFKLNGLYQCSKFNYSTISLFGIDHHKITCSPLNKEAREGFCGEINVLL